MPETLLALCTRVCETIGIDAPVSIVGAGSARAKSTLALANKEIRMLKLGRFWPALTRFGTINTVNGTDNYAVPSDFDCLVPDTVYPSTGARVRGADNPGDWAVGKSALSLRDYPSFRIYGNPKKFYFVPTPSVVQAITFEYKSKYPILSAVSSEKERFTADDDTIILDEDLFELGLTWRMKHARGLDYAEDFREHTEKVDQRYAQALATGVVTIGNRGIVDEPLTDGYVPEVGFGA